MSRDPLRPMDTFLDFLMDSDAYPHLKLGDNMWIIKLTYIVSS